MIAQPRRFILQARDPGHGSPVFEALFVVERLEDLRTFLGSAADEDPDLRMLYTLEPDEIAAICRHFDVPFEPEGRETSLYQWTGIREIPYLAHTGYELVLMLEGRKQFARMGGEYPPMWHEGEDRFDLHVAQGVLHKEVEIEPFEKPIRTKRGQVFEGIRTVYYTRKGEEWRIPAWKLVSKASRKSGWNEDFERLEGMLFGYEDWQNDWWVEHLRKRRKRFGTLLVYLAVTSSDLAGIEGAGYRSLPVTTRPLRLVSAFDEEPDDEDPRRLMDVADAAALVNFRVKALPFLELVGEPQQRFHELPPERIKDLNRLIVEDIELWSRPDPSRLSGQG